MSPDDELRIENALLKLRLADLEKALQEAADAQASRERTATIVEASNEAIFSAANDGTLLCWNLAAERLYGYSSGEAIGRNMLELVPFDRLAEHETAVKRATRGESVVLETMRRRADGMRIKVRMTYARLADAKGKLLGISAIGHALLL